MRSACLRMSFSEEIQQLLQPENAIVTLFAVASLSKKCANDAFQVKQMLEGPFGRRKKDEYQNHDKKSTTKR